MGMLPEMVETDVVSAFIRVAACIIAAHTAIWRIV